MVKLKKITMASIVAMLAVSPMMARAEDTQGTPYTETMIKDDMAKIATKYYVDEGLRYLNKEIKGVEEKIPDGLTEYVGGDGITVVNGDGDNTGKKVIKANVNNDQQIDASDSSKKTYVLYNGEFVELKRVTAWDPNILKYTVETSSGTSSGTSEP